MDAAFADFLDERVARGQRGLADLGRRLILERAPHWLDRLDFQDDRPFLDPLVFAHACAAEAPAALDAVLACYADGAGPTDRVEIVRAGPAVYRTLYGEALGDARIGACAARHGASVEAALGALGRVHPRFDRLLGDTLRRIVVFHSAHMNSFAALSCHGTVFLNAGDDDGPEFFVEDIAHQGGHVIFNAVLFAGEPLIAVAPETPLRAHTGREGERRTVCEAFHGVFTEAAMIECLDGCRDAGLFGGRELEARLAFTLRRFGSDARSLSSGSLFTPLGDWVFGNILAAFGDAYEKHSALACRLDFSNQPYKFSYARFVEANG